MTPEAKAREKIDHKLVQAGWRVQDFKKIFNPTEQRLLQTLQHGKKLKKQADAEVTAFQVLP